MEFSDSTNRFIILFLLFFFYLYLRFRQTQLRMKKKIHTVQCNPLEMVVASMIDENQANDTFQTCMEYNMAEGAMKSQKEYGKHYEDDIRKTVDQINENNKNSSLSQKQKQEELFKLLNTKTENVGDLVKQQQMINQTLHDSSQPLSQIANRIAKLSSKFKEIFNQIPKDVD